MTLEPVTEGWSNGIAVNPRLFRRADGDRTVILKHRRPPGDPRSGGFRREAAALRLLERLGSDAGPRLLDADEATGTLVLEDLGAGPSLEDLLVGGDPEAATGGFVAHARAIGEMHAATYGHEAAFPSFARHDIAAYATLVGADGEIPAVLDWMRLGPVALSNGDPAPQNGRLVAGRARLLDFEDAAFQHPLLDAAHLRLPFYGGPCWARIPAAVGARVEAAYRAAAGFADDAVYRDGMAAAVAYWTVVRLVRLPKLLTADRPHPMGYSRRGQLLDTLRVGVAATEGVLPRLAAFFAGTEERLRRTWPGLPDSQAVYPAYR